MFEIYTLPITYTFTSLVTKSEAAFMDQNLVQLTCLKLTTMHQGKHSLVEFFQQFELNVLLQGNALGR
jgi:hypothetical protein